LQGQPRKTLNLNTLAAHGGRVDLEPSTERLAADGYLGSDGPAAPQPLVPSLAQTAVFAFDSLEQLEAVWTGERPGYIYTRMGNPNLEELAQAVAALEGAEAGLVASSGTAAILACLLACLEPGDHLVATREAYGGTHTLLTEDLPHRFGIEVSLVEVEDLDGVAAACRENTRVLYVETLTNPLVRLAPLPELAALARQRGLTLVVDNTFATPYLLRPLEWGADVVVHSATKFLNGHGDVILGAAAGKRPVMERARSLVVRYGLNADPFAAWLTLRGLKTLGLRLRQAVRNAQELAQFLSAHPAVQAVYYPGLSGSPYQERARRMLPRGAGAVLSFTLAGGGEAAARFVRGLRLVRFAPSLGDLTTTISHPGLTSHRGLSAAQQRALGIDPGLIRVSVGIEDPQDLLADFSRALTPLVP